MPPFVLGFDVSGVVEEVGLGVTIFAPGDEVFGIPRFPHPAGAYAEFVTAPARHFVRKPTTIDHVTAAAIPLAALTAWQALVDTADVQPGQRVLVHAAASGVGHLAVQIAKARGAFVVGPASAGKHELLRDLGADELIDYTTHDFSSTLRDVDVGARHHRWRLHASFPADPAQGGHPSLFLQPFGLLAPVCLGIWVARRRVLEEPETHLPLLRRTAIATLLVVVAGGIPAAMILSGAWDGSPGWATTAAGALQAASGLGGIGYAACLALLVVRLRGRRPPVVTALAACGQRSLTCYLSQSVVFVVVLAAYGGGLGRHVGVAASIGIAAVTWTATVAGAELLRRRSWPGPAERLLRLLTYR